MITVRFKKAADDSFMGFRVSGHAGWAALGKDIVCAAVSATVWQTANGLVKFADAKVTQDKKGVYCIIPVPSEISAGCGLSWSAPAEQRDELLDGIERYGIAHEGVFEVEMY